MKLDLPLHLRLPLDEAWEAFNNAGAVARALPGATAVESDQTSARGVLTVDLGWAGVAYRGAIRVEESDPVARSITLRGIGQGEAGEGLGEFTAVVVLREERGATAADVALDVSADGQLSELMSDEPSVLAGKLGAALAAGLGGHPVAEPPGGGDDDEAASDADPPPIAPDIPEPQRLSPMEELALNDAARNEDGQEDADTAAEGLGAEPTSDANDEADPPGFALGSAFEHPPEGETGPVFDLEPEPAPPPVLAPVEAELPRAPRTGSIPPPGWTPPETSTSGGKSKSKSKSKAKGVPKIGRRAKKGAGAPGGEASAAAPAPPPGAAAGQSGLAGLMAKVRGALKR